MTDREKIINAYEDFVNGYECYCTSDDYEYEMHKAVLALLKEDCHNCKLECLLQKYDELKEKYDKLLKEQEAVEPTFKQDKDGIYVWACGSCGAYMYHIYEGIDKAKEYAKFCRQCGQAVKWNG